MDYGKIIAEGTQKELMSIITDQNSVWVSISGEADRIDKTELMEIPGVISVEIDDNTVKINNSNNINNLDRIIHYFTEKDIPIKNIENKTPDLETVFLTLTGRKLRD
jgi:ABC-2 type transport system ATP-binding protein